MGDKNAAARDDERPLHRVYLDAFWIYQYEVTNKQFSTFIEVTGYVTDTERHGRRSVYDGEKFLEMPEVYWAAPHGTGRTIAGLDNLPVLHMSWQDTVTYCEWAGGWLPAEAEWEKAAQGT